ncbi:MAG: hypothetical protein HY747_06860 [Elusimicrobia bacterium]|nr:hypothetical protein [Elusimicrobiota bacterium]
MQHQQLASGRWHQMTLAEQMGNIGSEVSRACRWQGKNQTRFDGAVERASELLCLTIDDPRWRGRRKELCRANELFWDAVSGGKEYNTTLESLLRYFDAFAMAARLKK